LLSLLDQAQFLDDNVFIKKSSRLGRS